MTINWLGWHHIEMSQIGGARDCGCRGTNRPGWQHERMSWMDGVWLHGQQGMKWPGRCCIGEIQTEGERHHRRRWTNWLWWHQRGMSQAKRTRKHGWSQGVSCWVRPSWLPSCLAGLSWPSNDCQQGIRALEMPVMTRKLCQWNTTSPVGESGRMQALCM